MTLQYESQRIIPYDSNVLNGLNEYKKMNMINFKATCNFVLYRIGRFFALFYKLAKNSNQKKITL